MLLSWSQGGSVGSAGVPGASVRGSRSHHRCSPGGGSPCGRDDGGDAGGDGSRSVGRAGGGGAGGRDDAASVHAASGPKEKSRLTSPFLSMRKPGGLSCSPAPSQGQSLVGRTLNIMLILASIHGDDKSFLSNSQVYFSKTLLRRRFKSAKAGRRTSASSPRPPK
jgi:hypothetical protein